MTARFEIGSDGLEKALDALREIPDGAQKAVTRALNRALTGSRADAAKAVTDSLTLKRKEVRQTLTVERATVKKPSGELKSKGRKLAYGHFTFRPRTDTTGRKRRPVTVELEKGKPFVVERGFVWNKNVWRRKDRHRMPIERPFGPAVPEAMTDPETAEAVSAGMAERFEKRLPHEVDVILKKVTK